MESGSRSPETGERSLSESAVLPPGPLHGLRIAPSFHQHRRATAAARSLAQSHDEAAFAFMGPPGGVAKPSGAAAAAADDDDTNPLMPTRRDSLWAMRESIATCVVARRESFAMPLLSASMGSPASAPGGGFLLLDVELGTTASLADTALATGVLPEIIPGLHIGSYKEVCDADVARERGIAAFLCVAEGIEEPFPAHARDARCAHLPLEDNASTELADHIATVFDFLDAATLNDEPAVVYCRKGMSRSVSFVVAYVMRELKVPLEAALEHVRKVYPRADPNFAFVTQLKAMEPVLRGIDDATAAELSNSAVAS